MFTTEHKIPSDSFHSYVENIPVSAHEKYHIRNWNKKSLLKYIKLSKGIKGIISLNSTVCQIGFSLLRIGLQMLFPACICLKMDLRGQRSAEQQDSTGNSRSPACWCFYRDAFATGHSSHTYPVFPCNFLLWLRCISTSGLAYKPIKTNIELPRVPMSKCLECGD